MNFKIKKEVLIDDLKIVYIIANKKSNFYNIKNFTIDAQKEKKRIFIYSSNIDVSFQKYIPAEVIEEGKFSVSAQKIFEVVKEIDSEEIEFIFKENQWLSIKGKKSEIKMPFLEKEEYEEINNKNLEKITNIQSSTLNKCLKKTIDFTSKDPIKTNLKGINIIFDNKKIKFYSSDSYVACRYIIEDENQEKKCKFIIPSRNITELFSYLENEEKIDLYFDNNFIIIQGNFSFLKVKLLDATTHYPDLEKYFQEDKEVKNFDISLSSFLKEIRLLKIILDEFSIVMKISLKAGNVCIESEPMETGQSKHYLDCNYEGDNYSIGLNIDQVMKSLQNMEEFFKEINFSFIDERMLLLKGEKKEKEEKENYKIIMMPMKINF